MIPARAFSIQFAAAAKSAGMKKIIPSVYWASASPTSAAFVNHLIASVALSSLV